MGDLIENSAATGVFLIIYSFNNDTIIQYIATQIQLNNKSIHMKITDLRRLEYGISIFALEDGLPVPGVVTSPKIVYVDTNSDQGLHVIR